MYDGFLNKKKQKKSKWLPQLHTLKGNARTLVNLRKNKVRQLAEGV
jgi:hypothetical protein